MPTAYWSEYILLGSLHGGNRAIHCYDWSDLEGAAIKKGDDWPNPGQPGVDPSDRVEGPMRALLHYRVNGEFDQDNDVVATTAAAKRANYLALMATVRATVEVNTAQTLQWMGITGNPTASCLVVDGIRPTHPGLVPWVAEFVVDVLLPGGAML